RPLAAMGFLTLGRRFLNNQPDIIDDRIDVVSRGLMGLTVTCARCHDHKYDPIPTKDYYSLYGIFASSGEPEQEPLLGMDEPSKARDEYEAEHNKRMDALKSYRAENENAMFTELRTNTGLYLVAAYEAQKLTGSEERDAVAHKYKLHPEVMHRWMHSLRQWEHKTNGVFTAWFAFTALPETNFASAAKGLVA